MVRAIGSSAEFNALVASPSLTVVDFHAQWCGPCKVIAPRFQALAAKGLAHAQFAKVDVDACADIAQAHSVTAMPTFVFFRHGAEIDRVVGADIGRVERLAASLAAESGAPSSFPKSGGRVLGSGAPARGPGVPAVPSFSMDPSFVTLLGLGALMGVLYLYGK